MKIAVCVKYCPDAQADRTFEDGDNTTERESVDGVLSELDEYAVEEALKLTEDDGEVVVLTMGPDEAEQAIRKSLQMGASAGYHIVDDSLAGSDAIATAKVLAAGLRKIDGVDLVMTGMASTDGEMSVVPAMVAEYLDLPAATFAAEVTCEGQTLTVRRDNDDSTEHVEVSLPALVSVTDQINEPRYPSFKGIMAAKKKPVETWSLADLGVDASQVGLDAAWTKVADVSARPPRQQGTVITDEGDGGEKLAEFLATNKLA